MSNNLTMESLLDIQTVYCETQAQPLLWSGIGIAVASNYLRYIQSEDVFVNDDSEE